MNTSELNRLRRGSKLSDGQGKYWRANSDDSVSLFQRIKNKDHRVARLERPVTAARLREARAAAALLPRHEQIWVEPNGASQSIGSESTLGELWTAYSGLMKEVWSAGYYDDSVARIRIHIEPSGLLDRRLYEVTTSDLSDVLMPLRRRQRDTENKVRGLLNKTFTYALARRYTDTNPVASLPLLWQTLGLTKGVQEHLPAIVDLDRLQEILVLNRASNARLAVRLATEVQARLVQRSNEILSLTWADIDDEAITIPRSRMKMKQGRPDQRLIIPTQVRALLSVLPKKNEFVFASAVSGSGRLAIESLSTHLSRGLQLKDQHVPHGWRSGFRTIMSNRLTPTGTRLFDLDVIEEVLDHKTGTEVSRAYNREKPTQAMGAVLQAWGDLLDV